MRRRAALLTIDSSCAAVRRRRRSDELSARSHVKSNPKNRAPLAGSGRDSSVALLDGDRRNQFRETQLDFSGDAIRALPAPRRVEDPHQQVVEIHDTASSQAVAQKRLERRGQPNRCVLRGRIGEQRLPVERLLELTGCLIAHPAAQRRDVASQHSKRQHQVLGRRAEFQGHARIRP